MFPLVPVIAWLMMLHLVITTIMVPFRAFGIHLASPDEVVIPPLLPCGRKSLLLSALSKIIIQLPLSLLWSHLLTLSFISRLGSSSPVFGPELPACDGPRRMPSNYRRGSSKQADFFHNNAQIRGYPGFFYEEKC